VTKRLATATTKQWSVKKYILSSNDLIILQQQPAEEQKERLRQLELEFQEELKKKVKQLTPRMVTCFNPTDPTKADDPGLVFLRPPQGCAEIANRLQFTDKCCACCRSLPLWS
jgi:hypothetical protein